jgi:hypothetical protein
MWIKKLQTIENATWDDEMKMIIMVDVSYREHIKVPVTKVFSFFSFLYHFVAFIFVMTDWVLFLVYSNLFETKAFIVIVVVL